jgi:hypothetical protein
VKNKSPRINWLVVIILTIVVVAISTPIYYFRIMNAANGDFSAHIVATYTLLSKKPLPASYLSHPLLQVVLAGISWITRSHIDPFAGMIIILVASQVVLALALYFWFGHLTRKGGDWIRALLATSLTIIAPILALVPVDQEYYYGYIDLANYHSPTQLLLRPLALISFIFACLVFEKSHNRAWMMPVSAVMVILSALAKPNYLICILPAMLLLGILWNVLKKEWDWHLFVFGFVLPGVLVLLSQWLLTYSTGETRSIVFAPFVEGNYSHFLLLKSLLSLLFPLLATILLFGKIIRDPSTQLAWTGFAAGAGMFYLLSEGGTHMLEGNFRWSAQIMLFLLMAALVRFCLRFFSEEKTAAWKRVAIWGAYLLHVASGVIYYIFCLTGKLYT